MKGVSRLSLLLSLLPVALPAQPDSARALIEGRVVDPAGRALQEAEVIWQGDRRSVFTKADGGFSLVIPVRGEAVILVRRPGYNAQALRVDLSKVAHWRGDIVLTPGSFQLPDIEVIARYAKPARYAGTHKYDDFFRRRRQGAGTFITRDDIEKMNAFATLEILQRVPGVYVSVGIPGDPNTADIRIPRCGGADGKVTVWIDGQMLQETEEKPSIKNRWRSFSLAERLARITPTGIEAMEVYRGVSEIPGEFHWDGCAAIVIWTR